MEVLDIKLSRIKPRNTVRDLQGYRTRLNNEFPEFVNALVQGYEVIGKTNLKNQFAVKKDKKLFLANLISNRVKATEVKKELSEMNIETIKLKDLVYNPNLFIPIKSNTPLDFIFSQQGGIMPATNYIVVGDPGIGKSSVTIQYAADIKAQNPDKKVLFISAEMTEWDMIPYTDRFPLWAELDILFTSKLTEGLYKESLEAKLKEGWDLVLTDSFSELADSLRGDYNETVSGKDKKSYNDIEKYIIDLMISNNSGKNDLEKNTSFISIQQVTKGGQFVGTQKLKHNTTGMIELRYSKGKERVIHVSKNRRGNEYQDLVFTFNEELTGEPIIYDIARIERDKFIAKEISMTRDLQLDEESQTDEWLEFRKTLDAA